MRVLLPLAFTAVFAALAAPLVDTALAGGEAAGPALLRLLGLGVLALGTAVWLGVRRMPLPPRAVLPMLLAELALIGSGLALLATHGPALPPAGDAIVIAGLILAGTVLVREARL
jgi:hypothetical protein